METNMVHLYDFCSDVTRVKGGGQDWVKCELEYDLHGLGTI